MKATVQTRRRSMSRESPGDWTDRTLLDCARWCDYAPNRLNGAAYKCMGRRLCGQTLRPENDEDENFKPPSVCLIAGVVIWAFAQGTVLGQTPGQISITRDGSQPTLSWTALREEALRSFRPLDLSDPWKEVATQPGKPLVATGNRPCIGKCVAPETRFIVWPSCWRSPRRDGLDPRHSFTMGTRLMIGRRSWGAPEPRPNSLCLRVHMGPKAPRDEGTVGRGTSGLWPTVTYSTTPV